jgi:hypothetical protein
MTQLTKFHVAFADPPSHESDNLTVNPGSSGESAQTIAYEFRLQYDRNLSIGNFTANNEKEKW